MDRYGLILELVGAGSDAHLGEVLEDVGAVASVGNPIVHNQLDDRRTRRQHPVGNVLSSRPSQAGHFRPVSTGAAH